MPNNFLSSQKADKWNNLKEKEIPQRLRMIYLEVVKFGNKIISIQIS